MDLNYRKLGSGHPLIVLHGLYGSGDNWLSIARKLSGLCEIYLIDQRNHGDSPHDDDHNYDVMVQDLKHFMLNQGIERAMILGHSMGGKVAMQFSIENPGMLSKLIVADISPDSYVNDPERDHVKLHEKIINSLIDIDLSVVESLSDVDALMSKSLPDERLRKFLMKNLAKENGKNYYWKLNLPAIRNNLPEIAGSINYSGVLNTGIKSFPVLFFKGSNSDYINDKDIPLIKKIFPLSNLVSIKNAGHWLHAEQPDVFSRILKNFIIS